MTASWQQLIGCEPGKDIVYCVSTDWSQHNLVFREPQTIRPPHLPPACIVQTSSLCLGQMLSCRVWHLTDIRDKTGHQSLSCTTCHQPRQDTGTQIFSWPCLLSVILSVSNISSKVQTTFYQNQFKPSGNNSRFSDLDQKEERRGHWLLALASSGMQIWELTFCILLLILGS